MRDGGGGTGQGDGGLFPGMADRQPGGAGRQDLRRGAGRRGRVARLRQRQRDDPGHGVGRRGHRLQPGLRALRGRRDQRRAAEAGRHRCQLFRERPLHRARRRRDHQGERQGARGQEGRDADRQRHALQAAEDAGASRGRRLEGRDRADEPGRCRGGAGARRRADGLRLRRADRPHEDRRQAADDRRRAGGGRHQHLRHHQRDRQLRRRASRSGQEVPRRHRSGQRRLQGRSGLGLRDGRGRGRHGPRGDQGDDGQLRLPDGRGAARTELARRRRGRGDQGSRRRHGRLRQPRQGARRLRALRRSELPEGKASADAPVGGSRMRDITIDRVSMVYAAADGAGVQALGRRLDARSPGARS